ncbi:unnamed protein product [Boreogadus saida]
MAADGRHMVAAAWGQMDDIIAAAAAAEGPCDACLRLNKGGEKYPGATTRPSRSTSLAPEGCGSLDPVCRALQLAEGLRGVCGRHRGVEEQRSHSTGISADTVHALLTTLQRYQDFSSLPSDRRLNLRQTGPLISSRAPVPPNPPTDLPLLLSCLFCMTSDKHVPQKAPSLLLPLS